VCGILHNKIIRGFKKYSISIALDSKENGALEGKQGSLTDHYHHMTTYSRCNMQNKSLLAAQINLFPTNCTTKFTYLHTGDYYMFQLFLIAIVWEKKYTHTHTHTHTHKQIYGVYVTEENPKTTEELVSLMPAIRYTLKSLM